MLHDCMFCGQPRRSPTMTSSSFILRMNQKYLMCRLLTLFGWYRLPQHVSSASDETNALVLSLQQSTSQGRVLACQCPVWRSYSSRSRLDRVSWSAHSSEQVTLQMPSGSTSSHVDISTGSLIYYALHFVFFIYNSLTQSFSLMINRYGSNTCSGPGRTLRAQRERRVLCGRPQLSHG